MGSETEAAEYVRHHDRFWERKEPQTFLRRLLAAAPFRQRLDRALQLKSELDERDRLVPGDQRLAKVKQLVALFDENAIPQIIDACRNVL